MSVALVLGSSLPALAAPGDLDPTFGKRTVNFTSKLDEATNGSTAIQVDGRVVLGGVSNCCGNSRFALARFNDDGTLDTTFGGDGKVTTNFTAGLDAINAVALDSDQKIVAAGIAAPTSTNADFALARYKTDGTLDTTFGGDGKVTTSFSRRRDSVQDVAVQADGKIVAAGVYGYLSANPKFALARYNTDGILDTTFSGDGKVTTDFTDVYDAALAVALQADGRIVVAGESGLRNISDSRFALARYNTDGTLDTTFSGDGKVTTNFTPKVDFAQGLAVQDDGSIVTAGESGFGGADPRAALARYKTDGTLDATFSGDGRVTTNFSSKEDWAAGPAIQADGKIVVAGAANCCGNAKFALARYKTDGTLDMTFGNRGKVTTEFSPHDDYAGVPAIQADGKIVAAGLASRNGGEFAVARYLDT